jgi:16S rRNA (cytosine967-C5)-methyltransferase
VLRAVAAGPPLSGPPGTSVSAVGVRTSHPDWIVALLREEYGESDALAVLELDNVAPAVSLRINRTCATAAAVERELQDAGVDVARGSLVPDALLVRETGDVGALPAVREGRATPQDQASQAIVGVLDPQPGERVLDVASAPGGKATGSAERMDDDGLVVAADLFPGRVRTVRRAARRLGLRSLVPLVSDGRSLPVAAGAADRVLLDAPCSGLGVLRRRPDARWRVTRDDVAALAGLQQDLLREVAPVVRPGGRLVYAVCTLTRAETADVVAWARAHLPEFVALDPPGAPWRPHGRGAVLLPSATEEGTDGMYVLALERAAR